MPNHIGSSEHLDDEWSTCTIVAKHGKFCDAPVPPDAPISACKRHLVAAFLYCENLIKGTADEEFYGVSAGQLAERRAADMRMRDSSVVYYMRIGEHVKIGTTGSLHERLRTLGADELLAFESGSYDLERQRHRQFIRSKAPKGREYFYETPDLTAHIASLREEDDKQIRFAFGPNYAPREYYKVR